MLLLTNNLNLVIILKHLGVDRSKKLELTVRALYIQIIGFVFCLHMDWGYNLVVEHVPRMTEVLFCGRDVINMFGMSLHS